jgi:hypothetical protein
MLMPTNEKPHISITVNFESVSKTLLSSLFDRGIFPLDLHGADVRAYPNWALELGFGMDLCKHFGFCLLKEKIVQERLLLLLNRKVIVICVLEAASV